MENGHQRNLTLSLIKFLFLMCSTLENIDQETRKKGEEQVVLFNFSLK